MKRETGGFSLIETIIALFVLTIGVVGAFIVVSKAIHVSPSVRQELIAANLAQEAIEAVRNIRDNTLLEIADKIKQTGVPPASPRWNDDIPKTGPPGFSSQLRLLDKDNITGGWEVRNAPSGKWRQVYRNLVNGFYANLCFSAGCNTDGWEDSGFRRLLRLEQYPAGCTTDCTEVRVFVKVFWGGDTEPTSCPGPNCILLEDRLTKWVDYMGSFL